MCFTLRVRLGTHNFAHLPVKYQRGDNASEFMLQAVLYSKEPNVKERVPAFFLETTAIHGKMPETRQ